ncbi:MAG: aspartate aminotransferase family protein [Reyranella sp.]|jgi:beta-alanine--pyruvate transaminase|uniref:aspartate aminotransferase family protein n=1 Tax=Reyranella sp. TaxID=1929291 RepID=UPI000966FD4F|nr:aspartate aminotransferase family protein [Reyranella sp.]MBN9539130.1 aspartate aminotransferase family protein [Alphaproteobacteria bacterium]MBR2816899.1 aspartate aminotransferase family protein [Reyranella sp.]OJU32657.1 MAG: aspartate aminotransferase family protein [Alphaproteobacteria bacterium 65-37]
MTPPKTAPAANNLEAFFMPFTANRQFKKNPRLLAKAKGVHYWTPEGRKVIDGTAGLWCVNAGHGREEIKAAIARQLDEMDYAPSFQMGHPKAFELAARHAALLPGDLNHAFYCNSGSEAVDSALKIALAYQRARGEGTRTRFVGRERGYHGVGFGGISVGGMVNNRKWFGAMLPGVDHLPHTHLPQNAFAKGQPEHGAELADELEKIVGLHDASNIAAVIVEPCAGSTGYLPPPKGYLQRLRQICDKHGILLIFDEVITGFGRLGTGFAADKFGVIPDLMTVAKGISNATVPMGGVFVRKHVFDGLMNGPENAIDLFHGYTYSAHPLACAAASAVLDIYRDENLFERAAELSPYWEEGVHSLKGLPNVTDIRNLGLAAGIDLAPKGAVGARGYDAFVKAFELGLMVRQSGDAIAMSPPLVIEKAQIDEIIDITAKTIKAVA